MKGIHGLLVWCTGIGEWVKGEVGYLVLSSFPDGSSYTP